MMHVSVGTDSGSKGLMSTYASLRIQVVKDGKKRKLVINGCKLEDAGKITCKTNADEASADLGVKCKYLETLDTIPYSLLS